MAGDEKARSVILEKNGLVILRDALKALMELPESRPQEKAMEEISLALSRLFSGASASVRSKGVSGGAMESVLVSVCKFGEFEQLAENMISTIVDLSSDPDLLPGLFALSSVEALCSVIMHH
eukprot:797623_1